MSEQLTATLKGANGKAFAKVILPRSASEVQLSRYVSFLNEMKYFDQEGANPIVVMARAVSEFFGIDFGQVARAQIGEGWEKDKDFDGGIRRLYGWAVNAVTNYKGVFRTPEDFGFDYMGDRYEIPFTIAAELGGLPMLPNVTAAEAIEVYEAIRGFDEMKKDAGDPKKERRRRIVELQKAIVSGGDADGTLKTEADRLANEIEIDGDPHGNLAFAQFLRMIAILCRKPGEQLPTKDGERERFIQSRMIHFQQIDAKTAIDVDFFLNSLLTRSKKTHPVVGSLILPLFALSVSTQSSRQQKDRRTIAQWRSKKKFGKGLAGAR